MRVDFYIILMVKEVKKEVRNGNGTEANKKSEMRKFIKRNQMP